MPLHPLQSMGGDQCQNMEFQLRIEMYKTVVTLWGIFLFLSMGFFSISHNFQWGISFHNDAYLLYWSYQPQWCLSSLLIDWCLCMAYNFTSTCFLSVIIFNHWYFFVHNDAYLLNWLIDDILCTFACICFFPVIIFNHGISFCSRTYQSQWCLKRRRASRLGIGIGW